MFLLVVFLDYPISSALTLPTVTISVVPTLLDVPTLVSVPTYYEVNVLAFRVVLRCGVPA